MKKQLKRNLLQDQYIDIFFKTIRNIRIQDGFLFVEGRATDYFTTKSGEKIYNFDIENVILEVDGVYQCEVVGRKQPDGYEEAFAFVIFSEKANKDKVFSEVQRICKKG